MSDNMGGCRLAKPVAKPFVTRRAFHYAVNIIQTAVSTCMLSDWLCVVFGIFICIIYIHLVDFLFQIIHDWIMLPSSYRLRHFILLRAKKKKFTSVLVDVSAHCARATLTE